MNHNSNICHFVSETGTTQQVAQSLLEEHGWNVVQAVKSYQCRQMGLKSGEPASLIGSRPPLGDGAGNQALNGGGATSVVLRKELRNDLEKEDQETDSVHNSHQQRLKRGMSNTMNNAHIVSIAHDLVLNGIKESGAGGGGSAVGTGGGGGVQSCMTNCQKEEVMDTLSCTFILPDINHYPLEFRSFLHKDLIETSTLISLEQAGRLNWWADIGVCQRLLPLATTGDGNCLLHAASLGIWGFHDRRLTLRKALCHTLNESSARDAFQRRWRFHQNQINKQSGLIYSEQEWAQEWDSLLRLASPQPRKNGLNGDAKDAASVDGVGDASEVFYESLEELHVFVLAHVLCRPIIIVADTILKDSNGDALAPISFGGIYLPMECDPIDCYPTPLLLTYDAAHFSAIVPMEHSPSPDALPPLAAAIPVVDPDFNLLPIHFAVDPGEGYSWERDSSVDQLSSESLRLDLLSRYLNLESLSIGSGESEDAKSALGRAKAGSCSDLVQSPSIECEDMSQVSLTVATKAGGGGGTERRPSRGKTGAGVGGGGVGEEDRARGLPRSMQNMVRSFGSLGRSFRNRIKNMAKTGKQTEGQTKAKTNKTSQRLKTTTASATTVERDRVLCARLQHRRQAFQEDMVRNYLQTALEKFEREQKAFCSSSSDGERAMGCSASSVGWVDVSCVNADCGGVASASTSYLCRSCFERQKRDELGASSCSSDRPFAPPPPPSSLATVVEKVGGGGGGIDRVESGPVLPRYVSPRPILPSSSARSCSSLNRSPIAGLPSSSSSSVPSRSVALSGRPLVRSDPSNALTPLPSTLNGNGDLTLYREGPPALTQRSGGALSHRPEDSSGTKDRSSEEEGGSSSRKRMDARTFEKELEKSLDDLQKSVTFDKVTNHPVDASSWSNGAKKKREGDGGMMMMGRLHAPVAAVGGGGIGGGKIGGGGGIGGGRGMESGSALICSNGPKEG